jgi:hypothetical protein
VGEGNARRWTSRSTQARSVGIASTGNRIDSRVEDSTPTDRINFAGGTSASRRSLPNRTYAEMAAHYGTAVLPTRPRWPRDKAKVEACVLIVERWLIGRLRDRRF